MRASRLSLIGACVLAGAATPAKPQAAPRGDASSSSTHFATVGGWSVFDHRGSCSAITIYDGDVTVRVSYDYGRDLATLFVANPAWESVERGATYRVGVNFNNGSEYTDNTAVGIRIDNSNGRLTGVSMSFDGDEFLEDFALAGSVELSLGATRLDRLSLRGTRAVAFSVIRCATASFRRHPPDPFATVSPTTPSSDPAAPLTVEAARARTNLSSYVSDDDYPASALRNREEGRVSFRLAVGPDGRVAECVVTSSSGSAALDDATCRIMRSRARFTPARDSRGNPIADTVSSWVTWRLRD